MWIEKGRRVARVECLPEQVTVWVSSIDGDRIGLSMRRTAGSADACFRASDAPDNDSSCVCLIFKVRSGCSPLSVHAPRCRVLRAIVSANQ